MDAHRPVERERFLKALRTLSHPRPDSEGYHQGNAFSFGHTRLSIVDLNPRSNQPMHDSTKNTYLTFNGEIYNYKEIKKALAKEGCEFRTSSDTEVILESYRRWGDGFLEHLNGVFAFGLYDIRSGAFLLARDRIGVKPLYYSILGKEICFASEPKAIIAYRNESNRINLNAVSSFLSYRTVLGTESFFSGINSLEPGTALWIKNGNITVTKYWDLDFNGRKGTPETVESIGALVSDAIRLQIPADVPYATMLSGGLDSSIIAHELSAAGAGKPRCFTARFEDQGYDESEFARTFSEKLGLPWNPVDIGPSDLLAAARVLIRIKDHPLGMHNELAMLFLSKEIRKHVKVVFCGEGADELFAGYGRIFRAPFDFARMRNILRMPPAIGNGILSAWGIKNREREYDELDFFLNRYYYFPQQEKSNLFNSDTAKELKGDARIRSSFESIFKNPALGNFFDKVWTSFIKLHLPGLLGMLDATTMAVGLEARVPFTDHRLVQAAFNLPNSLKIGWRSPLHHFRALLGPVERFSERHDTTKVALRESYAKKIPESILRRKKMGFPVPLGKWLLEEQRPLVDDLLFTKRSKVNDIFDPKQLREWFAKHASSNGDGFGKKLWMLCNLEIFLQEYF